MQLFMFVYVDDFKCAGKRENVAKIWDMLRKAGLDLDPPEKASNATYNGLDQGDCFIPESVLKERVEIFKQITSASAPLDLNAEQLEKLEAATPLMSKAARKRARAKAKAKGNSPAESTAKAKAKAKAKAP